MAECEVERGAPGGFCQIERERSAVEHCLQGATHLRREGRRTFPGEREADALLARIRWAFPSDIPSLASFFRKAYGEDTVFSSEPFLRWFFGSERDTSHLLSVIAVDRSGGVVAHYGGVRSEIELDGQALSLVWGVNSFTLPEHREEGLGGSLVRFLMGKYDVFGVISFTPKTAEFYEKNSFYLFDRQRFRRFVAVLDPQTLAMANLISADVARLRDLLGEARVPITAGASGSQELCPESFCTRIPPSGISHPREVRMTSRRSPDFLRWRFFSFPHPRYEALAWPSSRDEVCAGWLVARRERIYPTEMHMTRIVDLWGQDEKLEVLLRALLARCRGRGDAFVDCSLFGAWCEHLLDRLGFVRLADEDVALLPQVTCPAEPRPNNDFVGLFSERYGTRIRTVDWSEAYFTRMDSDRDRLSRRWQLDEAPREAV